MNDPRGSSIIEEYFAVGTEPKETCDVHKAVEVCTVSGLFATEFCPPETVEKRVMIQRREKDLPSGWDPSVPLPVADAIYEIPFSMLGEYCPVHGPHTHEPTTPPSENGQQGDDNGFFDNPPSTPENPITPQPQPQPQPQVPDTPNPTPETPPTNPGGFFD